MTRKLTTTFRGSTMFEEDHDFDAEIEHMDDESEPEDANWDFGEVDINPLKSYNHSDDNACAFCGCSLNEDEERAGVCDLCR
jgi:hypothetical protein